MSDTKHCLHCGCEMVRVTDSGHPDYRAPGNFSRMKYCSYTCASQARITTPGEDAKARKKVKNSSYQEKLSHQLAYPPDEMGQLLNRVMFSMMGLSL